MQKHAPPLNTPSEPDEEGQGSADAAEQGAGPSGDQNGSVNSPPGVAQAGARSAADDEPTTPLKDSIERARQVSAARKSNSGVLPALTPEVVRAHLERQAESANGEEASNGTRVRERRRSRAARVLGQAEKESALRSAEEVQAEPEAAVDPVAEVAQEAPAAEEPSLVEEVEPVAEVTSEAPAAMQVAEIPALVDTPEPDSSIDTVPAGNGTPDEVPTLAGAGLDEAPTLPQAQADSPASPAPAVSAVPEPFPRRRRERKATPVPPNDEDEQHGSNGQKPPTEPAPVRTRRLPETTRRLPEEEEVAESRALVLVGERSRTEPVPAIGISRKRLVSEEARREQTQRLRRDANLRWRRRRRYALYRMEHNRKREERYNSLLRRAVLSAASLVALALLVVVGYTIGDAYAYYQSQSALLNNLPSTVSRDNVQIFDSTGTLLYTLTTGGIKHYVPLKQMSINVINATIAVEDKGFWTNQGVDFTAIVRAATDNLRYGRTVEGGSGITQQLVKNTVLNNDPTFDRKIKEAILAVGITQNYSKQQILEMYLNSIGYGLSAYNESLYGVDAAAEAYFGLHDHGNVTAASQLDLAQAAMLAGIPNDPPNLDPFYHPKAALARQKAVLNAMVSEGYISAEEAVQAEDEAASPTFLKPPAEQLAQAPHFVDWIEGQLADMIDSGQLDASLTGLRVYTTLDLNLQNQVQQILQQHVQSLNGANVDDGAAVIIDQHTGAILTMIGSVNYYDQSIGGNYNVATQGWREMGSSFKPITYVTAFEKGWFPAQTIFDGPTAFDYNPGTPGYKPLDYSRTFTGQQTVRSALQLSLNVPAVKALEFAGIDDTLNMAERLGLTISPQHSGTPGLSMTLGSLDVHMMDLASAYSTFANYGVRNQPFGIWRITDQKGNSVFQYTPHGQQVISPQLAYLITSILSDNRSRAPEFGSCSPLYLYANNQECYSQSARPAAAKTGTTEDFRDDLTMGYTMDLTMGVWVGNDKDQPTNEANGIVGAAPIWHDAMLVAENGRPYQDFSVPSGVEKQNYCSNGRCNYDWFITGSEPQSNNLGNGGTLPPCLKIQPGRSDGDNWKVECQPQPPTGGGGGGGGGCPHPPCRPGGYASLGTTIYGPPSQSGLLFVPLAPDQQPQHGMVVRDLSADVSPSRR